MYVGRKVIPEMLQCEKHPLGQKVYSEMLQHERAFMTPVRL